MKNNVSAIIVIVIIILLIASLSGWLYYSRHTDEGFYSRISVSYPSLNLLLKYENKFPDGEHAAEVENLIRKKHDLILRQIKDSCRKNVFVYNIFKYCFEKKPDTLYLVTYTNVYQRFHQMNEKGETAVSKNDNEKDLDFYDYYPEYIKNCYNILNVYAKLLHTTVKHIAVHASQSDSLLLLNPTPFLSIQNTYSSGGSYKVYPPGRTLIAEKLKVKWMFCMPGKNPGSLTVSRVNGPVIKPPRHPHWKGSKYPVEVLHDCIVTPNLYLFQKLLFWDTIISIMEENDLITQEEHQRFNFLNTEDISFDYLGMEDSDSNAFNAFDKSLIRKMIQSELEP